jgi:asparagine synthase (glutamine-hydrolysing)
MCGIVGIVTHKDRDEIERVLARMQDRIVHRGPDDSGSFIARRIGLAMRRLSIIDLAGGHQPMHTADGVSIVFNGEIYNYVALGKDLIARGYRFKTKSDTEVILNLYHAEGPDSFKKLNGMFAVAIYDRRNDELILARDQIGIKPLYYMLTADGLIFASEIKAILAALPGKPPVNAEAVWDFLSLRSVPPPNTIWEGIVKLEPGHVLRYQRAAQQAQITRFWFPNLSPDPLDAGHNYEQEFEQHFMAAVESHIVASDVPVGTFLSGGLDSGAICAASIELGHRNFHTFSISGEGAGKDDELPLARLVSQKFGTNHHEIVMTRQLYFDQLDTVAWHFDEPYGDETGAAVLLLSRLARQHVKVVMSGEGSDELLLGYVKQQSLDQLSAIGRRYRRWPRFVLGIASQLFTGRRSRILSAIAAEGPNAYRKGAGSHIAWVLWDEDKTKLWRADHRRPTHDLIASWYTLPTEVHPLVQSQQAAFQSWLVENLLMKADKMSMAESLETRVPFLHLPLVEWCQRSPMELRIGPKGEFRSKAILRKFVAKRLPTEILNAPKRGFPVPVISWFGQMLREQKKFTPLSKGINDWIRWDGVDNLVTRGARGDREALATLWGVSMLDRWFKVYLN